MFTSEVTEDSTPSAGRLRNAEGAWCFNNESISSQTAILTVNLGRQTFVTGFASQGPPEGLRPKNYNHVIGFSASYSLNGEQWSEFNAGNLFFDNADKNATRDVINYHVSSSIELTQYVKINVTMLISGATDICLRFEFYGCGTDIQPVTNVKAMTTSKGQIEVSWKEPTADTSLEEGVLSTGILKPNGYLVFYQSVESRSPLSSLNNQPEDLQSFLSTMTTDRTLSLEDVRLGATYHIILRCIVKDFKIDCGWRNIEAYPPCPEGWTGGNEYHCFLYITPVTTYSEARDTCAKQDTDQELGKLGTLVDDDEKDFLTSRILPEYDVRQLWFVKKGCDEQELGKYIRSEEECCSLLNVLDDGSIQETSCGSDDSPSSAVCLWDHKGEGARIRVSAVESSEDGVRASIKWRYEGKGWKTDELQAKLWTEEGREDILTYSTLKNVFEIIDLKPGVTYSLLLRPAPNIRTEEFTYKFVIIQFEEEAVSYGALLTPVPMSIYVIGSGFLKLKWENAKTLSASGQIREASKYSITHQRANQDTKTVEVTEEEFLLTPLAMREKYSFELTCYFANTFYVCGSISITTDVPDYFKRQFSGSYTLYETFENIGKNWAEAESDCLERSGHLTSVLDESEAKILLQILPYKDVKVWTGAKIGRKGSGFWTDGQKITYLPMAKTSGVTSSSESCCRALNEAGKLRLAGTNCEDENPYICKYSFKEILAVPVLLTAKAQAWDSVQVLWNRPEEYWLPTYYNVLLCSENSKPACNENRKLKDELIVVEGLQEYTIYKVTVEALLEALDAKTVAETTVMTYPKSPVRFVISSEGVIKVQTPMMVALGKAGEPVKVIIYQSSTSVATALGDVSEVQLTKLIPEESYEMLVQQDGGDWEYRMTFNAVPTCIQEDLRMGILCYRLEPDIKSFDSAKAFCNGEKMNIWSPDSVYELENVAKNLELTSGFWIEKPSSDALSGIKTDESCSKSNSDARCCSYNMEILAVTCSCCDTEQAVICVYEVKANLGQVSNLLPSFIGNTSIQVEWSAPEDISWNIQRYEAQCVSEDETSEVIAKTVEGLEVAFEGLEFGTDYEITITPFGSKQLKGQSSMILIQTLDPRTAILVTVESNGIAIISSPRLIQKGRGNEEVDISLQEIETSTKNAALKVKGTVEKTEITGLKPGTKYAVTMTPAKETGKPFNYNATFTAYPSCGENRVQDGFLCVWTPEQKTTWKEAFQICKNDDGELLDYNTQKELTAPVKAQLVSHVHQRFWVDISNAESQNLVKGDVEQCAGVETTDVMCCSYELAEDGELDDLKCTCCDEPRPFACKSVAKIDLGDIGDILVQDVTMTSLKIGWTMVSDTNWKERSFMVTWESTSSTQRRKREIEIYQKVVKDTSAVIEDLKPGTTYRVAVAPHAESIIAEESGKEVIVSTRENVVTAGYTDSRCMLVILKISCCITVILGTGCTVFVLIATKMLYLDCLAQIFSEISTLAAYLCILVSSAHSYSVDEACVNSSPKLCVAVCVLIQFFFQGTFLFLLLESVRMCSVLKEFVPGCCSPSSPFSLIFFGFGIPAVMTTVSAAIASDEFSDGDDNCWLNINGRAMLPSVLPNLVFGALTLFLLLSMFDADQPRPDISPIRLMRGRVFLKTRWACFAILVITAVSYGTGMMGANNRDSTLNYVFIGFSTCLGFFVPLLRIRCDDQIKEKLKKGLFSNLRDDLGGIRVTPAPDKYDPKPLLQMEEFNKKKYHEKQITNFSLQRDELDDSGIAWHR
ncbi:uncharacterized protein LOC118197229 isoform X2 [Stegodyphus dumicola]|uniref:uncharacterized protein LOC118197229 isoform X2 n=1 Tax=Stegodyphus dumicola TaxID=202533 RepID=UPI0015AAA695|nr:uncharacterized protein LOC118197229 isoform X2 [Stegodyphus dumicola]